MLTRSWMPNPAGMLLCVFVLAQCGAVTDQGVRAEERSLPARSLWQNTRLTGTPEPPPPYTVERVFTKITWPSPMYLAPVPDANDFMAILQGGDAGKPARIVRFRNEPDVEHLETILEMDRRLIYAFTFHPRFISNRHLFVFSNGPWNEGERANRISRFTVSDQSPFTCDIKSELVILEWRSAGHDGGDLVFGNDGMLYIASGDGTGDSDTWNSGQDVSNLLAAVLRIDVDHPSDKLAYSVPADNPFVGMAGARGEIWAYGFRNPWRMCVDAPTGDIWVGNNGQDQWETAYLVRRGDNFGWSVYEGSHPFYLERKRGPTPIVPPTIEHAHSEFRSLTGGVVYRGARLPELDGAYIYGDYSTGRIWGARHKNGALDWSRELADTALQIAAFCVDQRGDLLVVDHGGGIYRLVPASPDPNPTPFPTRLSDTGLFESTKVHLAAPGLIPFAVNSPGWSDGATAQRYIALPGDSQITYASANGWNLANGAVAVQTLSLDIAANDSGSPRRIETRLLVRRQGEWTGYTYRWNEEQTDASLVPRDGEVIELRTANKAAQKWRIPSRAECLACHSRAANYLLGLCELQMNREYEHNGTLVNQLRYLEQQGALGGPLPKPPEELGRLVDPYDDSHSLEARARSYLHANCSGCHVSAGGGNSQTELSFSTSLDAMKLIAARPQHDTFNIPDAMLVAPGQPDHSVLLRRLSVRGRGQMPPLASNVVDEQAVAMFRRWIDELKPLRPFVRDWQIDDLSPHLDQVRADRSLDTGKAAFRDTGCIQCHRFGNEGGTVGPDLTGIGRRQTLAQLLESIMLPSKVIPDAYAAIVLETEDGEILTGRVEREDERCLVIRTGNLLSETSEIPKSQIRERTLSQTSNMPLGIVNVLKRDEIFDLLAYLISNEIANPQAAAKQ